MSFCPFCCNQYGNRQNCESGCKMWIDGDCIIKKGFMALAKTNTLSQGKDEI